MNIVELKGVTKQYQSENIAITALNNVSLQVEGGEMLAIMGPSGSGKSTLMNIIGLLDRPSTGELKIGDESVDLSMSDAKLAKLRSAKIGFVFQTFNLLHFQTALENVLMPTIYSSKKRKDDTAHAKALLERFGLGGRIMHRPAQLSGGEKQRVAIARSLINDPDIILADEPTGNLDSKNGHAVLDILQDLNKQGKTVIIVTHDPKIASLCKRTIEVFDGAIIKDK